MPKKPEFVGSHLRLTDANLRAGQEWKPTLPGWTVIYVKSGCGYWVQPRLNRELSAGSVLLISRAQSGTIRASQLGAVTLSFYHVLPELLMGLVTLGERKTFDRAAFEPALSLQILTPEASLANILSDMRSAHENTALSRIRLLGFFLELFKTELKGKNFMAPVEAKKRLETFLNQTPPLELLNLSLSGLAQAAGCTPRHASRTFREITGISFREEQVKIRLRRATELLTTTDSKVVDVALESGYASLSLFNLMFKRCYGVSPSEWRNKQDRRKTGRHRILTARSPSAAGWFGFDDGLPK